MNERDELAKDIDHVLYTDSFYGDMFRNGQSRSSLIDAILAAGYRKMEPRWAETLTNDGTYEYTISAECDGSNVQHWRRTPDMVRVEYASPWKAFEPEES